MSARKFVMKRKPTKPVRGTINKYIDLSAGTSLADILKQCDSVELDKVKFEVVDDGDFYSSCLSFRFCYHVPEPEEDYNDRLAHYERKIIQYHKWEEKNAEQIAIYQKNKEDKIQKAALKKAYETQKSIRELEDKLSKLKRKL